MIEADLTVFQRKLKEHAAKKQAAADALAALGSPVPGYQEKHEADLIPELPWEQTDADTAMDKAIDSIDIIDAYARWCGKMVPIVKGTQTESIMISCPIPGHTDRVPSAWINTDKQTWFCGACNKGGDTHDIAAYHFGYPVPAYKDGARFHELRRDMAKDFGFTIQKLPGGGSYIEAPVIETEEPVTFPVAAPVTGIVTGTVTGIVAAPVVSEKAGASTDESDSSVTSLFTEDEEELSPELLWRQIIPEDTFMNEYMKICIVDDVPEEYHFWNGLLALGFALGRDVKLADSPPVYSNLFICTLGRTGSGKSKAAGHFDKLIAAALPYKRDDNFSKGVVRIESPGSAEALIHAFEKQIVDGDGKPLGQLAPVRGLIDFNELAALVGKASRAGNVTIPVLQSLYDMKNSVSTSSISHGYKEAFRPYASLLTTTQPKALRDLLHKTDANSGFLNRWVFAPGRKKKRIPIGLGPIDMTPAVLPLQQLQSWADSFKADEFVTWSDEAREAYVEFDEILEKEQVSSESDLITRANLLIKKLILLFTANMMLKEVPAIAVRDAIFCWPYIRASFTLIDDQIGNTLQREIEQGIKNVAKRKEKGITLSQIKRSLVRRKYPTDLIIKCVDLLVQVGELKIETTQAGAMGRPTVRYKYVS